MNTLKPYFLLQIVFCLLSQITFSQAGLNDPTFNSPDKGFGYGQGCNITSRGSAVQADGKVVIVGSFNKYNDKTTNRIVRVLPDGQRDETFNPYNPFMSQYGFDNTPYTVTIQPDQKILVTGVFTKYQGITRKGIVRINSDGTNDNTFTPGTGIVGVANHLAVQPDGKILIAGSITSYNGTPAKKIVRINADGTIDNSFSIIGTGFDSDISGLSLQNDGRIIVTHSSYLNGATVPFILRLNSDGSVDNTFNAPLAPIIPLSQDIALQSDGKIITSSYDLFPFTQTIHRLNSDGSLDTTFSNIFNNTDGILKLVVQSDDKIVAMGKINNSFTNGETNIIRLNANGTFDPTFEIYIDTTNATIFHASIDPFGRMVLTGFFEKYLDEEKKNLVRLHYDGKIDQTFNPVTGTNGEISCIKVRTNDQLFVGGGFSYYNNLKRNGLAKLHTDGEVDTSFVPNYDGIGSVYAVNEQTDGKVLFGGWIKTLDNSNFRGLFRLDQYGNLDTSFVATTNPNSQIINTIAIQSDNKILIGGSFTNYGGSTYKYIARLNTDGTIDYTFNTGVGFNNGVWDIEIQSDDKILVAGYFTNYDNNIRKYLARLNPDGSIDPTFVPNPIAGNEVRDIDILASGNILISGDFSSYNNVARYDIARIYPNGSLDYSFNTAGPAGSVNTVTEDDQGNLLVGGIFPNFGGQPSPNFIRLTNTGSIDNTFDVGTGTDYAVNCIDLQSTGRIIIAGKFKEYNDLGKNYITRLFPCDVTIAVPVDQTEACGPFVWPANNSTYSSSGTYFATSTGTTCDTLKQINLSFNTEFEYFEPYTSSCHLFNEYDLFGNVKLTSYPGSGSLIIDALADGNHYYDTIVGPLSTTIVYPFNIEGLPSNGQTVIINAYIDGNISCAEERNVTAPQACGCNAFSALTANIGNCQPTNTFHVDGDFEYDFFPDSGVIVVHLSNASGDFYDTILPPFSANTQTSFAINDIPSNGDSIEINVYFSEEPICTISLSSIAPNDCSCQAFVGTFTNTSNGLLIQDTLYLYAGDSLLISSNNDTISPQYIAGNPTVYDPGIGWLLYSCEPDSAIIDLFTDPCLLGFVNYGNFSVLNDGNSFLQQNTVHLMAPLTFYSMAENIFSVTSGATPYCYDTGEALPMVLLDSIQASWIENNSLGEEHVTVSGGLPEFNGSSFTISNLAPAWATLSQSTVANNGTFIIEGLLNGDIFTFDLVDENNHVESFQGLFGEVCLADAGSFVNTSSGTYSQDTLFLYYGDSLAINSNGDNIPPSEIIGSSVTYDPGLGWFVYNCAPDTINDQIYLDTCLIGLDGFGSFTVINDVSSSLAQNNSYYITPITFYSVIDSVYSEVSGTNYECFDYGTTQQIVLLDSTGIFITESIPNGQLSVTAVGGLPAFNATEFTISNLAPAWATLSQNTVVSNGTFFINNLNNGDFYSFNLVDQNSISQTFQGVFGVNSIEQIESDIKISPNPADKLIDISLPIAQAQIQLLDSQGRALTNIEETTIGQLKIDVSLLPAGTYFAKISTYIGVITQLIIVQH